VYVTRLRACACYACALITTDRVTRSAVLSLYQRVNGVNLCLLSLICVDSAGMRGMCALPQRDTLRTVTL